MTVTPAAELAKMWPIFPIGHDNPISLRAISPALSPTNITFTAREYPDTQVRQRAFEVEALRLNEQGYNVYIVMNPINPDFEGGRSNGLAVCDEHIACRHRLLIDLDRVEVLKAPATATDIQEAGDVADRISDYLQSAHAVEPFRVMSGNGIHLYVPLDDFPNDNSSNESCRQVLRALAQRFNTDNIKVDTAVYNASRITKVPGTIARKGDEAHGRPYRMACVL